MNSRVNSESARRALRRSEDRAATTGGWISFARYMELALHEPGLGYYAGGARKFGAEGDFVTAPELGSLFGRTLARQLREFPRILEIGAGSGALAEALLKELDCEYWILETSAELRDRQRRRLGDKVRFLDTLPARFSGVIIANEVVDAMPVHAVAWRDSGVMERGVAFEKDKLSWKERPATGGLRNEAQKIEVPIPYESEIGLAGRAWMRTLGETLEYGRDLRHRLRLPARRVLPPAALDGHADVPPPPPRARRLVPRARRRRTSPRTSTSARSPRAARDAGARGARLRHPGAVPRQLRHHRRARARRTSRTRCTTRRSPPQAQKLLSPAEMGELFKVLAVGRGAKRPLLGFSRGDRSHTL